MDILQLTEEQRLSSIVSNKTIGSRALRYAAIRLLMLAEHGRLLALDREAEVSLLEAARMLADVRSRG